MNIYETEKQLIDLRDVEFKGRVLDVGGGGEGIISRHSGDKVVAIDKRKDELEETLDIGLKIVMDATDMKFLNNSFENITCFYTLMYMREREIEAFLTEAFRVLKPGGFLWFWDAVIPALPEADVYVAQLEVIISDDITVTTGYGAAWEREQSPDIIQSLCEKAGFVINSRTKTKQSFFLRLLKQ